MQNHGIKSLWDNKKEIDDAEFHSVSKLFTTLSTSSSTRFGRKRKVAAISYRRYEGSNGMIKKMYEDYSKREKTTGTAFARRYATWEFNNKRGLRESLQEYIENKPEEAACVVMSTDQEGTSDSWIKDAQRIRTSMDSGRTWVLDFPVPPENWELVGDSEFSWENSDGEKVFLDPFDIPIRRRGIPGVKYILALDPGLGNVNAGGDAFGVCLGHAEVVERGGKKWNRPVIDFAFRFTGRMFPEGEIQFAAIQALVSKLNNLGYRIHVYSMDGWNVASLSQWLRGEYPEATVVANSKADGGLVTSKDYTTLRDAIFSEAPPSSGKGDVSAGAGIDWFWHPVLYWELKELVIERGTSPLKVDHKPHTSKDLADATAKVVRLVASLPVGDVFSFAGTGQEDPKTAAEKKRELRRKQSEQEKEKFREVISEVAGLGRFR